ncbi:hypothetical protein A2926_01805 [Candidatus Giovannonibacteria bacterium RIFCSPLOWO2_01_FULL_44_40]|uniref:Uncharacterized protein n=1 Tax=Candidatus Giovannonibacteria bacterium RIFCSPHIGHO2_01_FULL_45_23 TaxID=1798325 RepID=A0A1F5VJB4_9BACT|nr:MAG: hypothetical protein A2834_01450 [Candidatus Giovannonibacteria bacterium RIFCSPHIGHO2_01_FULL_45_23]OGF76813.1 MAG: hypothetical protein A3C77_00220 [Candidatus Giovannonibacteria bacterium RIFCSPHIGHO2_02_FULL_45_13]OGF79737.1 MAG: hypothetical protein A2926_01805 [Candidatus Giovannonibacteria bacterium RIFCSPLOWO2_01_FULL_44_40]
MATLTIEIPKEVLRRANGRRLLVVDPKEFADELKRHWEVDDAVGALKIARQEQRSGKLKELKSLRQLMK